MDVLFFSFSELHFLIIFNRCFFDRNSLHHVWHINYFTCTFRGYILLWTNFSILQIKETVKSNFFQNQNEVNNSCRTTWNIYQHFMWFMYISCRIKIYNWRLKKMTNIMTWKKRWEFLEFVCQKNSKKTFSTKERRTYTSLNFYLCSTCGISQNFQTRH